MTVDQVCELSRVLRAELQEKKAREAQAEKDEEIAMQHWKRMHDEECDGRCEYCAGEGGDADSDMVEEREAPDSLAESRKIQEDINSTEGLSDKFTSWFREHNEDMAKMINEHEGKTVEKVDPLGWMPKEARAFMRCISLVKAKSPGVVINHVRPTHPSGWKKMRVTVDSGAAESVIPSDEVVNYAKHRHAEEEFFQTASGEPLRNEGEQRVPILMPSGKLRGMTFQSCDVTKPLASVKRLLDCGHACVFAPEEVGGSFILNLETGDDEPLVEEEGNYHMDVWVPPPSALPGFARQR